MSISPFLLNAYSEDLADHTEADELAMNELIATEQPGWEGYTEWSAQLERDGDPVVNESENFMETRSGRVLHKPQPPSHRLNGFEI